MKPLELKIPPPLVTLACAALAWGLSALGVGWHLPAGPRLVGAGLCLLRDASGRRIVGQVSDMSWSQDAPIFQAVNFTFTEQ